MKIKYLILIGVIITALIIPRSQKIYLINIVSNIRYQIKECLFNESARNNKPKNSSATPSPEIGTKLSKSLNYIDEMNKKEKTSFQKISKK